MHKKGEKVEKEKDQHCLVGENSTRESRELDGVNPQEEGIVNLRTYLSIVAYGTSHFMQLTKSRTIRPN